MKLLKLATILFCLVQCSSANSMRANVPDVVYERSGYSSDEITSMLQTRQDCPQYDVPTQGVIRGPPRPTPKELAKRNAFVQREGSSLSLLGKPFPLVGPNIYWLGIDENVEPPNATYPSHVRILEAMALVKSMKGTTIRGHTLGVSVGLPLSLEPNLDEWNEEAFETIDFSILAARIYGLKLIVPLTDNYNWYHGGKYQFIQWHGIDFSGTGADISPPGVGAYFYNTTEIVKSFERYIDHLLNHVNRYTGIAYKDDPTIAVWESGNELSAARFGEGPPPAEWTRHIAQYVKKISPQILFGDGSYGIYPETGQLEVEEVDIFSDHFYPPDIAKMTKGLDAVKAVDKTYLIGEFDWTGKNGGDSLDSFLEAARQQGAFGSFYWSLFGRDANCCQYVEHEDGFEFYHLRDELTTERGLIMTQSAARWRGVKVPELPKEVSCPQRFIHTDFPGLSE